MMKVVMKKTIGIAVLVLAVMGLAGMARAEQKKVELGGAASADVFIKMGGDSLKVESGAADLMNGDFTFNPKSPPEIGYGVVNGKGSLTIKPGSMGPIAKRVGNDWQIKLNNDVPLNLAVEFSTGTCDLELAGLNLSGLQVKAFSGDVSLDLAGPHPGLPKLDVDMDYGTLTVAMKGEYPAMSNFNIALTSGVLNVDLGRAWTKDVTGLIKSGNATTVINVPRDIGVIVEIKNSKSVAGAEGLKLKSPGVFVNDAYGLSPVTMKLAVENRKGTVSLELSE